MFGVTCHHMNEQIDSGTIIATKHFPIYPEDSVESLRYRAALYSLGLLKRILPDITKGRPLLPSGEHWGKHLYTYKELRAAQQIHSAPIVHTARQATLSHFTKSPSAIGALKTAPTKTAVIQMISHSRHAGETLSYIARRRGG